ncbi:tail fiber domain-containing protein [Candidatus Woesebacteria bacterium]|nr:tail fiber domain-containing protein [Candidatus Woesebacteria bacterium]
MKNTVQLPSTHTALLTAFRTYLASLGLSSISRKLYSADIARLLASSLFSDLNVATLTNPKNYASYLSQPELTSSSTLLRRTLASLRQFGTFLNQSFDLPSPITNLSLASNTLSNTISNSSSKYIKACMEYLKDNHLTDSSIRSYKSDITQYLTYLESHHPSTQIGSLLTDKNLQNYTDLLTHLDTQSPATIERKIKTIRRFLNWYSSTKLQVVVSDNTKIPASSSHISPLSSSVQVNGVNSAQAELYSDQPQTQLPDHKYNNVKTSNYRKLRLPTLRMILSGVILLVLVSTLSIFSYRQFGRDASLTAAFPSTPVTPNRQLSFQGRLENASGTPITAATNFVFKLHDASSGGSELYSSGTCSITPDTDGVFSTQIGGTCGAGIASSVFTENADVWLEVTVGAETLTPRQQIATVAYALNSETIQGFPISATVSAIRNTVVPMNQWGEIIVGEQSPRLTGVSGTFQISAPSLSLVTATGTNGNITLAPDGTGQVNVNGNTTTTNFFNVSNAQLTTGSLITGTAANNNTGFNLLDLLSGASPTSKFSVSDSGDTTIAGTLSLPNSNNMTGVANGVQFNEGIFVGGGTTYYFDVGGELNAAGGAFSNGLSIINDSALSAFGQVNLGDGGETIHLNGTSITLTGFDCTGNTNGGALTTNGSGVLQCSDDDGGGGGSGGLWQDTTLGAISPNNSTWDVLVGGTATSSAKIGLININSGTPTINLANQASNLAVIDNTSNALRILEGANNYLALTTTNASENLSFGNTTTNPTFSFLGTGLTTLSGGLTVNGITTIGNNSATVAINSSDWDITTVGNMSGIGTISSDGDWTNSQATPSIFLTDSTASSDDYSVNVDANVFNITNATDSRIELDFAGNGSINFGDNTATKTIDIGGVTSSAIDTINIGTNATAADIISIGNNHASTTLALTGGTAWSITTAGNLTTNNTTVNGNTILGNAITDTIDFQGRVLQDADLIPITTTGTNDLGSSALAWDNLYTNAAYFAGGTSFYVDASGNARFNDIIAADTANPGITVGDGSTGFLKVGSLTVGDNNASVVTFDTNSDATPEFQLYNTGSATASGDITMGGQLQVGRFENTPTAIGAGTMIFNTTTNSFQCYNGTAWTSCGGTLFSNSNASVADGSYITVTHNLASNDLLSNAWINAQGVWKSLDASYKPAIAWEGKDTQKGIYHNALNSYIPSSETGTGTNTLHEGMIFDTFEDTTKTDSANTTVSTNQQIGDDGSSNFVTLDQRIQGGRVGLVGGQTLSTGETDNDGQAYLGSNTVNDMYYYDRAKDSVPEVLVELGIDPNWYNGVTLSVATGSASYSQSGTLADKNPNLTTTYNGSLIKATGTDSTPRTIFITIKSPTTFDWTNYEGDSATAVTITPGTAQALGSTGVSATFTATNYNVGDVFKIASWYIEAESATRGAKQQFPERSYVVASGTAGAGFIDVIDADTQKLWIKFTEGTGYYLRSTANRVPHTVDMLNGKLYFGQKDSNNGILERINFDTDSLHLWTPSAKYTYDQGISQRNTASNILTINTTETTVANDVNDVSAAVIPNQPSQQMTLTGWRVHPGNGTATLTSGVDFQYPFTDTPQIQVSIVGRTTSTTTPKSLKDCSTNVDSATISAYNNNPANFYARFSNTTFSASYNYCFVWSATGTVAPKQIVAVATGTTGADGGTTIINETDGKKADILIGSQNASVLWQNKVALAQDGTLYVVLNNQSTATTLNVYAGASGIPEVISQEPTWAAYRNGFYYLDLQTQGWSATGPVIKGVGTNSDEVKSLSVTSGTSSISPGANTIYVGTSTGVTVLNEANIEPDYNSDEPSNGSVKYYTKDYVSEEMIGDVRGMWGMYDTDTDIDTAETTDDVSIKNLNLTANNANSTGFTSTSGVRGEGITFDGTDDYFSRADDASLSFSNNTMSASYWVKRNGNPSSAEYIMLKGITTWEYASAITTAGKIISWLFTSAGATVATVTSNLSVTDNEWHHVAITSNGSTIAVYIDGQLDNNSTSFTSAMTNTASSFYVGDRSDIANSEFQGSLDELMITGTALSSSQVRNIYQVGYRALQSHTSSGLGTGGADTNQQLGYISTGTSSVGVVQPDYNNQYMYVGTNSTTLGALSKIQLNSDTNIKTYNSSANVPTGGVLTLDEDITSLAVGETLYAVGSAASGVKTMGLDNNATATSGNFVSKTYALPKNIGSAVLWVSPIMDSNDGSNTITVQASNDGGSNYATCTLVNTNTNYDAPEREYACTFTAADNDLKVRFQMARGNTKTNTYVVQYGISWLGETGFRVEQADNNNVRLYNFSGEAQNLKLNITGASTSALANPWTDGGSYIYATGYETLRIYDGAGTNYLGLSHDGTYATLGYNGTDFINLTSTGDLLPETNDTQALGSDSFRWEDVFLGPGSVHVGTSTTDEGVISYDTSGNILNIGTDSTSNGDIAFFTDDLYLDKSSGFIGLGDITPDYLLDVAGTAGFDSTLTLTGSAANVALGSNYLSGDGGDEGVYVDSSGNVGIGNASPDRPLQVTRSTTGIPMRLQNNFTDSSEYWVVGPSDSDNFAIFNDATTGMYIAYGATSWTANSDERLKTNIEALTSVEGLASLLELTPVNYNWKDVNTNQSKQTGFLAQEVQRLFPGLVSLGETTTITLADGSTQTIEAPLGVNYTGFIPYIIKGIQEQQAQISQMFQNLITPQVNTAMISPLAPGQSIEITAPVVISPTTPNLDTPTLIVDGEIEATTISARVAQLETIRAETITARDIVADTITANSIVGLDAKIASLSAGISESDFDSISERIRSRLASLTGGEANAQDVPAPPSIPETVIEYSELSTASATLATADIDFVTVNQYLAVIGSATITSLDITSDLYTNRIGSKDNLLAIQPLGGIVNIADSTFVVDSSGQVMVNGDLTVSGRILAESGNLGSLELGSPLDASASSALGNLLSIYNEQGQAVATIDASGSANLAGLTTQLVTIASGGTSATQSGLISSQTSSNSTAGVSTLLSPDTELTIDSPYVTANSLVYLTPTTNTDNKVLFVKAKVSCPEESELCTPSFTVGIDAPASTDIGFNWWIIELKQ